MGEEGREQERERENEREREREREREKERKKEKGSMTERRMSRGDSEMERDCHQKKLGREVKCMTQCTVHARAPLPSTLGMESAHRKLLFV
jgi:hypothetical protein